MGVGIDGLVGVQTLQSADILVGTDEVDELHATLNGTGAGGTFAAPSITDIEILNLTAVDGLLGSAGLDLMDSTGYTDINNVGSAHDLSVVGIKEIADIGMDDVRGGTTYYLNFTSSADTSVVNVNANAVGTSQLTGQADLHINANDAGGIETLNLEVSNIVRLEMEHDADGMSVFNIAGSGITQLSGSSDFRNLEVLDSTGYTGDLTLDVSGSDVLTSVETGGGDDWINIDMANANGGLSVDLGGGADTLSLESAGSPTDENDINGLNFTGGVAGVEVLAFANPLDLGGDATLNMDGISADLETLDFTDGIDGDGNKLTLAESPVGDLTIDALTIEDLKLDTGNVVNLDVNVDDGVLDLVSVSGSDLETLALANTSDPSGVPSILPNKGDVQLTINSSATNDVSALQSISADASEDAFVTLLATNSDADMNALTTVSVEADAVAHLFMEGAVAEQQVQTFEANWSTPSGGQFTLVLPSGDEIVLNQGDSLQDVQDKFAAAGGDYTVASTGPDSIDVTRVEPGPADLITMKDQVDGAVTSTVGIGVPEPSFNGTETVVVEGDTLAVVNLENVYGEFTLDVAAEGTEHDPSNPLGVDLTTFVHLENTGATEVTAKGGDEFIYDRDPNTDEATSLAEADVTLVVADGAEFGNANLTSVTVDGAAAVVWLDGDLSNFTTLDLTDVANLFAVDTSNATFDPAAGDYVSYLIGATASELEGSVFSGGDSVINMNAARETVTFNDADFGTVVLNEFNAGNDPVEGDRIDLSQLGFTNNGQLSFETGEYTAGTGEWKSTADGGADQSVRITDLAGGPEMGSNAEIIVTNSGLTGNQLSDDLQDYNMTYA